MDATRRTRDAIRVVAKAVVRTYQRIQHLCGIPSQTRALPSALFRPHPVGPTVPRRFSDSDDVAHCTHAYFTTRCDWLLEIAGSASVEDVQRSQNSAHREYTLSDSTNLSTQHPHLWGHQTLDGHACVLGNARGLGLPMAHQRSATLLTSDSISVSIATLALALSSGAYASLKYRNYGTSYYNELAGGLTGAADLGMHRQFWGYTSRVTFDWLNANAPYGATVAFHNTTYDSFHWYQRDGLLRDDLRWRRDPNVSCRDNGLYLFHHQESFAQDRITAGERMRTDAPHTVFTIDNVPVISVIQSRQVARKSSR